MAITNGLITLDDYARYIGYPTPIDPVKVSDIEWAIESASRSIQAYCGRSFLPVASSARYFDATGGSRWLDIDDATAVSEVAVDVNNNGTYTALTASDYQLVSVGLYLDVSGPYVAVRRVAPNVWPDPVYRIKTVRVTAAWGWAAVPDPVQRACAVYTQDLLRDKEAAFGGILTTTEGVAIGSKIPRRIADLCGPYRRMDVVGGIA